MVRNCSLRVTHVGPRGASSGPLQSGSVVPDRTRATKGVDMQRYPVLQLARIVYVGFAAVCALAVLGTAAAAAPRPVYQPPQSYYLALGDSMTYGFQPTKAKPGARPSEFHTGYVDVFAARLRKLAPAIRVVNYGCPGESTVTFVQGGCPGLVDGFKL